MNEKIEGRPPAMKPDSMSLEEFARMNHLDSTWVELRCKCNQIVARPDFWYRGDLRDAARELAVRASDILTAKIKREQVASPSTKHKQNTETA
ncbi:MAG: hypothetical protein ACRD3F_14100 [Acidobacteriaceae bacterium]